jgi:hypothetical protein
MAGEAAAAVDNTLEMSDEAFLENEGQINTALNEYNEPLLEEQEDVGGFEERGPSDSGVMEMTDDVEEEDDEGEALEDDDEDGDADASEDEDGDPEGGEGSSGEEEDDGSEEDEDGSEEGGGDDGDESDDDADPDDDAGDDGGDEDDASDSAQAKSFYDKVTAPFQANGRQMQITDPDQAVRLMQMGANYNQKMAAFKPIRRVAKMLEKAELLDENKLGYLIDLQAGNPEAIAKLLKDHKVNPMDLDLEQTGEYKASDSHKVDDREMALDEVLDDLKDSPTYDQTLDLVTNQWDAESKQFVARTPQLLKVIDGHMASGVYDRISTEVQKERMFGRLLDVSDLEAYRLTGDRLDKEGAFADLFPGSATQGQKEEDGNSETPPREKGAQAKKDDKGRREKRRRAASSTRRAPKSDEGKEVKSPLALSDEDFAKEYDPSLL